MYSKFFWFVFSSIRTSYLSIFSLNAGKYGPEKFRTQTRFTQLYDVILICNTHFNWTDSYRSIEQHYRNFVPMKISARSAKTFELCANLI